MVFNQWCKGNWVAVTVDSFNALSKAPKELQRWQSGDARCLQAAVDLRSVQLQLDNFGKSINAHFNRANKRLDGRLSLKL